MSRTSVYVWSISAAGAAAILVTLARLALHPADPGALIPAVLAVVSGATVLRLRSVRASFSIGDAFTFSALYLYGVEVGTATVALETLAISIRLGGPPRRIVFNTAAPSLAMWLAGTLVFGVAGIPLPAHAAGAVSLFLGSVIAVALTYLLGSGFVAAAVAFDEKKPVAAIWREHFASLWTSPAAGGYIGGLVALFAQETGLTALVALLPIPLIVYRAFSASLARADDALKHLGEMNRMYESTIEAFATAVDAKDQVTHGHIRRVQTYSIAVAKGLGITDPGR